MSALRPLTKLGLLLVAILMTTAVLVWAAPRQPLNLKPLGEEAIQLAPAIHISLAGGPPEPARQPTPTPVNQPKPEPKPKPEPEPEPQPEPEPKPEPEVQPDPVAPEPKPQPEPHPTTGQLNAKSPEKQAMEPQTVALQNAGSSADVDNYLSRLSRHLARFYDYPRRARRQGQEGTPVIVFEFRRDGSLVRQDLRETSGHELLDEAALKMLAQAAPLPEVPRRMQGQTFRYALPVRFRLR